MYQASLILKSKSELEQSLEPTKDSLAKVSKQAFWKSYFLKKGFHFYKKKFNWETFRQIPIFTKEEFSNLGLQQRISNVAKLIKKNPFGVVLANTSGTTGGKPMLQVQITHREREYMGRSFKKKNRELFLFQPRNLGLRTILSVFEENGRKSKGDQLIVVNPFDYKNEMTEAICQMHSSMISTFPLCIPYLTSAFPKTKKIFSTLKEFQVRGDFFSQKQADSILSLYPNLRINIDYITREHGLVGIGCRFLKKKYGFNAYHPFDGEIVELVNIDEESIGEIVVTKFNPLEISNVRYRTGDLAKAIEKPCPCGNQWSFSIAGRSNLDHFKVLGALISRLEIEKALKNLDNLIEEWRGEVREIKCNGSFIGELKLILKPSVPPRIRKLDINQLKKVISSNLRLTPNKTLEMLAKEKKFMPLKIELTDQFPQATKKILLRKILD